MANKQKEVRIDYSNTEELFKLGERNRTQRRSEWLNGNQKL
jgi:hypothetical protein